MLCSEMLSLRSFEEWLAGERRRRAQEMAESKELEEAAMAQVGRPRQRWCIGSGESEMRDEESILPPPTCIRRAPRKLLTPSTARHRVKMHSNSRRHLVIVRV